MTIQRLLRLDEEVGGIEPVVAQELEEPAVELAGAGLGGRVQHAARLAELGGIRALLDPELLQRVDGGLDVRAALMVVGHVDAVDLERELAAPHPADGGAGDEVGADAHEVAASRQPGRARRQPRQLIEAPPVERQVRDLRVGDVVGERARFGVEQGDGRRHLRRLGERAHLQLHVHPHGLADGHVHRVDDGGLEALADDGHLITAGVHGRHDVVAAIVGRDRHGLAGRRRRHRDRRLRDRGLLGIADLTDDAPRLDLRPCRRGQDHRQEQREPRRARHDRPPLYRSVSSRIVISYDANGQQPRRSVA